MGFEPEVVTPQEHAAVFAAPLARILRRYGCILAVDEESRSVAKGTGVFVDFDGVKLLVTAHHVVDADVMKKHRTFLMVGRRGPAGHAAAGASIPRLFALDLGKPLWLSRQLDVAVFILGPDIASAEEVAFFDARESARVTAIIRKKWKTYSSQDSSGAYFVAGFPSFGHLVDQQAKIELLSALPLPSYITQMEEYAWDRNGGRAPQLILEVDAHKPAEPPPGMQAHHRAISENLFHPPEGVEPFGGFSGGPVVTVAKQGEYLIGVTHDGGLMFDQYRVFASAWDDCLAGLEASSEWSALLDARGKGS